MIVVVVRKERQFSAAKNNLYSMRHTRLDIDINNPLQSSWLDLLNSYWDRVQFWREICRSYSSNFWEVETRFSLSRTTEHSDKRACMTATADPHYWHKPLSARKQLSITTNTIHTTPTTPHISSLFHLHHFTKHTKTEKRSWYHIISPLFESPKQRYTNQKRSRKPQIPKKQNCLKIPKISLLLSVSFFLTFELHPSHATN